MSKPFKLAVKAVNLDENKRCLLIRRSPVNHNWVGKWEWPGGKVDPGEDFATAVLREVREETSLEVEITGLAGAIHFEMPAAHIVLVCLEARRRGGEIRLSVEHDDFAWVPLVALGQWDLPEDVKSFMLEYAQKNGTNS